MELSAENIEDLAIAMTGNSHTIGPMDGAVFENKSDFGNLDVNQPSMSDPQDYLYNTQIELDRPSSTSCSLNDILDDICDMSKTMELEQASVNESNSQFPYPPTTDLPLESPVFFQLPDIEIQQGDYNTDGSFSNQANFLQPLGQWSEYLSTLPPALENLQEVPQLTTLQTALPSPPTDSAAPQETSSEKATINLVMSADETQLVSSAPVVPLQLYNNFHFNISSSEGPQFFQQIDKNFIPPPQKRQRVQKHLPNFGWARVVPRKTFVPPAEVMILRPLRTRKVSSSRQNFDLSAYFDTSAISIPMIRERPRCKNTNRRKQKLHTIPGAENLIFEIDMQPNIEGKDDSKSEAKTIAIDANNNTDKLYAEAEIPELDEIFKRKRRGPATRRNLCQPNLMQSPTSELSKEEEEEKESTIQAMCKKETVEGIGSNSDVDSDDTPLNAIKSMKCENCKKLFKTSRSLKIHMKRCESVPRTSGKDKLSDCENAVLDQKTSAPDKAHEENAIKKVEDEKQTHVARPLTRSQTGASKRKSSGLRNNLATKRKC